MQSGGFTISEFRLFIHVKYLFYPGYLAVLNASEKTIK
jgi:hypothetical protein